MFQPLQTPFLRIHRRHRRFYALKQARYLHLLRKWRQGDFFIKDNFI